MSVEARAHFTTAVDRYYGASKRLDRPGMMDLFVAVCDGVPADLVTEAVARCAGRSAYLPTPVEFQRVLQDLMVGTGQRSPALPEKREDCPVCAMSIRYYLAGEAWRRFSDAGGLMFRLHPRHPVPAEWYAARCWACKGPQRYAQLPIPRIENRPAFVNLFATDGAERYVTAGQQMAAFFDAGAPWRDAERAGAAYADWEQGTVQRTLALMAEAAQAAERPRHA